MYSEGKIGKIAEIERRSEGNVIFRIELSIPNSRILKMRTCMQLIRSRIERTACTIIITNGKSYNKVLLSDNR